MLKLKGFRGHRFRADDAAFVVDASLFAGAAVGDLVALDEAAEDETLVNDGDAGVAYLLGLGGAGEVPRGKRRRARPADDIFSEPPERARRGPFGSLASLFHKISGGLWD